MLDLLLAERLTAFYGTRLRDQWDLRVVPYGELVGPRPVLGTGYLQTLCEAICTIRPPASETHPLYLLMLLLLLRNLSPMILLNI